MSEKVKCHRCYIGVGSNLGDRFENINSSKNLLERTPEIRFYRNSSIYETEPSQIENVPDFYNCVFEIDTSLEAEELLKALKDIEKKMGRNLNAVMESRIIDLDILTYDSLTIKTRDLIIPHSRMHERLFVVAPLNELVPDFIHPVFNLKISSLMEELQGSSRLERLTLILE